MATAGASGNTSLGWLMWAGAKNQGRTADSSEAACGLTAPLNFIVCKYCRDWDPTDLRTLAASRVDLFVPRVVALIIIMAEQGERRG